MSLILEALRKSEAARRRGESPNVYVELPPSPRSHQAAIPPWAWWALACAVLLIALWLAFGSHPGASVQAPQPSTSNVVADKSTQPATRLAPVPRLLPTPQAAPSPLPSVAVQRRVEMQDPKQSQSRSDAMPARVSAASVGPSSETSSSGPEATRQLSDLAAPERASLPPLKLSMHMWNADPTQRFVILDGNRLREGDRVGEAVINAITADGVILDWNGRRLKLPIR